MKTYWCAALALVLGLAGCASQQSWLTDFEEAEAIAQKDGTRILLLVTANGDELSPDTIKTSYFTAKTLKLLKGYTFVHLDFSESRFNAADLREEDEGNEALTAAAELAREAIVRDSEVAQNYNVQDTPMLLLLTQDGYVIGAAQLGGEGIDAAALRTLCSDKEQDAAAINELLAQINAADGLEKAALIDNLYELTDPNYRHLLYDFYALVPGLDVANTTGLVGKYLLPITIRKALALYTDGNDAAALKAFDDAAKNSFLTAEQKQETLYYAALFLQETSYPPPPEIIDYLTRARALAPETEIAQYITEVLEYLQQSAPKGRQ